MKTVLTTALALVAFCLITVNAQARVCKKGKPCGNSCISVNDVCHKDSTTSKTAKDVAPTAQEPASKAAAAPTEEKPATAEAPTETKGEHGKVKNCKKGKPCGNSCIPADAVCHQ